MNYDDVLSFWFNEIEPSNWWVKDANFDRLIEDRFLALHEQANRCELFEWRASAQGRLAEIIVLDQLSRNIFRDTPKAFASDPLALALSQEAISLGKHHELNETERSFLYMPFMHSESLKIHDVAVVLFKDNGVQATLDFEIKHRDIIAQFGRYPHRNLILERASTDEEMEFLKHPNSGF
ncbi:DUF924 family protein [Marinomonas transparens]|uniref:DUF924 domain-containing protein n=1 Tax=Marinomonas transparens TaxID=2795388 RepID=A0A934N634_9GAMM|nr:DUF924 family protein [Marinomonas transparens]MBJ7537671.1 DUF924 domain-containing protein [Marinomonas transparens]